VNISNFPFFVFSRDVEMFYGPERVYCCICLMDIMCNGVSTDREAAIRKMADALEKKYGGKFGDDFKTTSIE
jgi:hypothetical protein